MQSRAAIFSGHFWALARDSRRWGEDGLDGVGVDGLDDGDGGALSGVLDGDHLVTDSGEDGARRATR